MPAAPSSTLPDQATVIEAKGTPFAPVGESTTDPNGVKRRTYRKELIRTGRYVTSAGQEFEVTPNVLDHWAATFAQMDAAGVKVPVPVGHTDRDEKNRGWVRGMERDGESLYGLIELVGEDAIEMASRTDVSIFSPQTLTDGRGVEYMRPIAHVALTSTPVIPGLGEFEVVASLGKQWNNVPVLRLANGDGNMESLKKIADKIGLTIEEGMSDEAILAAILAKLGAMDKAIEEAEENAAEATQEAVEQAVAAARTEWEKSTGKATAKPDPLLVKSRGEVREMKLARLVEQGKLTPAASAAISKAWIGDNYTAVAASLTPAEDDRFDAMVKALEKNELKDLAEKTGQQVIALSRTNPGMQHDDSITKLMLAEMGVKTA